MTNADSAASPPVGHSSFVFCHYLVISASSLVIRLLTLAIRGYQLAISPAQTFLFGPTAGCRFTPSCSCYALDAVQEHGAIMGGILATKRICRCHPWSDGGYDPVPEKAEARRRKTETQIALGNAR